MDDKNKPQTQKADKKPYSQEKSPEQVKREIVARAKQINLHVRDKHMQDSKPIFVDKG